MPRGVPPRPVIGATAAAVWLALVVVADLLLPSDIVPAALLAFAPLLAAATTSVRSTVAFGVAATVLAILSGFWNDAWGHAQHWLRLLDVVIISAASVAIAKLRADRDVRYARLSAIAEVAQRAILPKLPTESGSMRIASRYLSAFEDSLVGGDLFDYTLRGRSTRLIVGDVRGKGVAAVEHAARVIRAFRQFATGDAELADAAGDISAYVAQFFDEEDFATAILVESSEPGRITVVNCGHPAPILVRHGAATVVETPFDLPLGLGAGYEAVEVAWQPGDRLLLFTDGLSEARSAAGDFLPLTDLAPTLAVGDVDAALGRLMDAVRRHVPGGRLDDDVAVVLLEHTTTPATVARPRADFALPLLDQASS